MGIKAISILDNVNITIDGSGGTSALYREDGVTIPNGFHAVATADADYLLRRQMTAKVKQPVLDPKTRKYGKGKRTVSLAFPILDPIDGTVIFNTFRIELEVHPYLDATAILGMRKCAVQVLMDEEVENFWTMGAVN